MEVDGEECSSVVVDFESSVPTGEESVPSKEP